MNYHTNQTDILHLWH